MLLSSLYIYKARKFLENNMLEQPTLIEQHCLYSNIIPNNIKEELSKYSHRLHLVMQIKKNILRSTPTLSPILIPIFGFTNRDITRIYKEDVLLFVYQGYYVSIITSGIRFAHSATCTLVCCFCVQPA